MAKRLNKEDHQVTGYLVVEAEMVTATPLRIGSGKDDRADVEVIRRPDAGGSNLPYVPAAGMVGALYHRFLEEVDTTELAQAAQIFWGTPMAKGTDGPEQTWQSHLRVPDMDLKAPQKAQIVIRDGVRIDHKTNTAEEGKKYNYEMLEPGCQFTFRAEITLRKGFVKQLDQVKALAHYLGYCLQNGQRIGGKTTRGFGELKCEQLKFRHFDFQAAERSLRAQQVEDWFRFCEQGDFTSDPLPEELLQLPIKPQESFSISAKFGLKTSLLIGAAPEPEEDVDQAPLRSQGHPVVSGTSLAGVVRHRALKILRTLRVENSEKLIQGMFGHVDEAGNGSARKSRVITHEARLRLRRSATNKKQTRIRIDRFTGGPIRSGLFEAKPVWREKGQGVRLRLDIRQPKAWEPALLMHVIKDLWSGDLAIGGGKSIGRGVWEGEEARFQWGKSVLQLKRTETGISLDGEAGKACLAKAEEAFRKLIHQQGQKNEN